jgi:hypothetical protein
MAHQETELYRSAIAVVTTQRIFVRGVTYATRQVNSVQMGSSPPERGMPILVIGVGLMALIGGAYFTYMDGVRDTAGIVLLGLSAFLLIAGVKLWLRATWTYSVWMSTSNGQIAALVSPDRTEVERVIGAISEAIARHT